MGCSNTAASRFDTAWTSTPRTAILRPLPTYLPRVEGVMGGTDVTHGPHLDGRTAIEPGANNTVLTSNANQ